MADLKIGTTVGGSSIWTQSNFPLFPTGNSLLYRDFTIYSTNDKPQASDNDFVSKANGGIYLGALTLKNSNSTSQMLNIQGSAAGLMLSIANADGTLTNNNYQMYAQGDLLRFRGPNGVDAGLIDIFQWNNATGAKQFEVRGNIKVLTGGRILDSAGGVVYSPQNKPTPSDVGALALTGGTVTGEIISTSNGGNNYRMSGTKSVFQRFDGGGWYFMISDSATGTYNDLRPLTIGVADGKITMANGLIIQSGLAVNSGDISVQGSISATSSISSNKSSTDDATVRIIRIKNSSNNSEFNFNNAGNGIIQINRANITNLDFGALPLRTVGPIHVATAAGNNVGSQGTHIIWNENGDGRGTIIVNQGQGTGGFNFRFVNSDNSVETGSVRMDGTGTLRAGNNLIAVNRVHSGNGASYMDSDGNIYGTLYGGYFTNWLSANYATVGTTNNIGSVANDASQNRVTYGRRSSQAYQDGVNGSNGMAWESPAGHFLTGINTAKSDGRAMGVYYRQLQLQRGSGAWFAIGDQ